MNPLRYGAISGIQRNTHCEEGIWMNKSFPKICFAHFIIKYKEEHNFQFHQYSEDVTWNKYNHIIAGENACSICLCFQIDIGFIPHKNISRFENIKMKLLISKCNHTFWNARDISGRIRCFRSSMGLHRWQLVIALYWL